MNVTARSILAATLLTAAPAFSAELQDAPPVDLGQILQALRGIKEQQLQQAKALKQKALQ